VLRRMRQVLVERACEVGVFGITVDAREERADLFVRLVANGPQQGRRGELALAVDLDPQLVLVVGLELQPCAAVRNDLGGEEHPTAGRVLGLAVVDARRADELADRAALGTTERAGARARRA